MCTLHFKAGALRHSTQHTVTSLQGTQTTQTPNHHSLVRLHEPKTGPKVPLAWHADVGVPPKPGAQVAVQIPPTGMPTQEKTPLAGSVGLPVQPEAPGAATRWEGTGASVASPSINFL